jgi:hypothetical protein
VPKPSTEICEPAVPILCSMLALDYITVENRLYSDCLWSIKYHISASLESPLVVTGLLEKLLTKF